MEEVYDFSIDTLGECKIPSPIDLATHLGHYKAKFVTDDSWVRYEVNVFGDSVHHHLSQGADTDIPWGKKNPPNMLEKAGPRRLIYFMPQHVNAGICTCGGLCPGINDVIRSLVRCLYHRYKVRRIRGIRYGFSGFFPETGLEPIDLNPVVVDDIHKAGGSFLGTSRGGGERVSDIADAIEALNLNMMFIIGGDGTQRGSLEIAEEIERRGLKVSVIGIPKTIDNDVSFIQSTFGFDTAVAQATAAVAAAHMEAHSHLGGVGLIKLMGREAGFIATHTALASHEANFCLIPEIPFDLEGPQGFLARLKDRLAASKHAVVIVAEGAGQEHMKSTGKKDASGNIKLNDIGVFLRDKISEYCKAEGIPYTIKYIDPSYQIRSAIASPADSIYCERLGSNAVHAAMAGKTKTLIGLLNDKYVHIPIKLAVQKRKRVDPTGALWRDALDVTGQPMLMVNDPDKMTLEKKPH
ncbi:MAG: ATP-dependent 6-phosphofructokinase [Spirochaetaceae bacterium]|jgi:6-phosphofructokinase 1|nr:ATP-dependent 6-phosphofructokinase [Spirochaetaceae bacterium]